MNNVPIYRAKIFDSDEYIIGFFHSRKWDGETRTEYYITYESLEWEIDPTTLSIHFPDMIDSQGNKIFASLQKDGKGGDIILEPYLETERETVLSYENYIKNINKRHHTALYSKIIGIQQ